MAYAPFDLSGHGAVITGGNSGIGLGFATALTQAGADVAIWGTNEEKNAAAAESLKQHGTTIVALRCDVGDEQAVDEAMARSIEGLGRVDSCFANAGIGGAAPFVEMTSEEWHRVLRVNLDGAFFTLRAAARHMVERGDGGSLVATSSLAAIDGQPRGEHYAASKGGLVTMMKAIAVELARYRIRANVIQPGWIATAMTAGAFAWDKFRDNVMPRIPARRWGQPEDFGGIAVYLASPASSYHTGDTFLIDGGYSIF